MKLLLFLFRLVFLLLLASSSDAFRPTSMRRTTTASKRRCLHHKLHATATRRDVLCCCSSSSSAAASLLLLTAQTGSAAAPPTPLSDTLGQLQRARRQLEEVPGLIREEKWDSVRAILIQPPLADCWAKTARPLLSRYAESVGDAGGDELAALEAKEEVNSHLRYLDMAVYNNVFNPIKTEGETGATRGLIKSYYEDPINEWKASVAAMDELIKLAKGL
jgi:hypothetical protein